MPLFRHTGGKAISRGHPGGMITPVGTYCRPTPRTGRVCDPGSQYRVLQGIMRVLLTRFLIAQRLFYTDSAHQCGWEFM